MLDPRQDNWRAGNWAVVTGITNPQWTYVTATGTASSSMIYIYMDSPGEVHVDDLMLVAGSVAGVGKNYVQDGDFESALRSTP